MLEAKICVNYFHKFNKLAIIIKRRTVELPNGIQLANLANLGVSFLEPEHINL
jgi:hypothetical protein